jgi:cytochrome d ubiquinol oxidase subunit II
VLYAKLFSGFYLALMAVLWLLLFRALSIELRHHIVDPLWTQFWDVAFCVSSTLVAALFGCALGNLVRGVSMDKDGNFFAPLWTDFRVGEQVGILDWFTAFISVSALMAVAFHGALWLAYRTDGAVQQRAARIAGPLSLVLFGASGPVTMLTAMVQPQLLENLTRHPFVFAGLSCLAFGGMLGAWQYCRMGRYQTAFRCSALFLVSMVVSAAFGVYPQTLAGRIAAHSLTVAQSAAPASVLEHSLYWFVPGVSLAATYTYLAYRRLPAVFSIHDES